MALQVERLRHRYLAENLRCDAVQNLRQALARARQTVVPRPITACAGSGSRATRSATAIASSCVPQG